MGIFLLKLTDGSEMILTAGRATRTDAGDVTFESIDPRGNWSRFCTVKADDVHSALVRKTDENGAARWVRQDDSGHWWAY